LRPFVDRANDQPIGELLLKARLAQQPPNLALLIAEIAKQRTILR
jgi:hypothetical protein